MVTGRLIWNCALIVAGVLYLGLVFSQNIESPIFAAVFVGLAGFEVIHTHRANR
jgi:hypothetical protein